MHALNHDGLLPVVLAPSVPAPSNAATTADADANAGANTDADADADAGGIIVLVLGEVRVDIEGQPNAATLTQVLDRVLR